MEDKEIELLTLTDEEGNEHELVIVDSVVANGTEYLAPAKSYTIGAWTTETITFTLDKVTEGVLSLGYDAVGSGSGAQQALFFDCVKIETVSDAEMAKTKLAEAIAAAQATVDAKAGVGEGIFLIPTTALDTYAAYGLGCLRRR